MPLTDNAGVAGFVAAVVRMAQPTGTEFKQKEEDVVVAIHDTAPMGNDTKEMKVENPVRFQFQEQQISMVNQGLRYIRRFSLFLRLTPFDTSISGGLAHERYRRAVLTSVTSVIAKGVSILTILISVPLTLNYLGTERYGLWMTISSVVGMLIIADFGLGNGLVNAVSQADGRNSREDAITAVSSAFFILSGVAVLLSLVFGSVYSIIPWSRIFNVSSVQAKLEAGPSMAVFFACFALNLPLGVVQRVQFGYQEGFLSNLWQIAGSVLGLICLLVAIQVKAGLPWLVLAMSGTPTLVIALNWFVHFACRRLWLWPRWSHFEWKVGKTLLGTGLIFMLLTIVNVLGTSSDNIIVAQFLGASAVATYSVVQQLFLITLLVQYVTVPLWPAFSEALSRGDYAWTRRTFLRINYIAISMTIFICASLLLFGRFVIAFWAGSQVVPSWSLLLGYTIYRLVTSSNEALVTVLNTGPFIHRQLLIATVAGVVAFVLKIVMVSTWQLSGVPWAGAIAYGFFYIVPAYIIIKKGLLECSNRS